MKRNGRKKLSYLETIREYKRGKRWSFLFLVIFSTAIILYSVVNMMNMNSQAEKSARDYADKLTSKMANMVTQEISSQKVMVSTITDSMERIKIMEDDGSVREFLERKRNICGFDFVAYQDMDNLQLNVVGNMLEIPGWDASRRLNSRQIDYLLRNNSCIVTIQESNVIYLAEVKKDKKRTGVLFAGNDAETMREILSEKGIEDKSYSCVVNKDGKVILSSDSAEPIHNMNQVFADRTDSSLQEKISYMKKDIAGGVPGIFSFISRRNEKLFLSYTPMNINDWVMLTLIPNDLFAGISEKYMQRAFWCLVGTVVAFFGFLYLAFQEYNAKRRSLERIAFSDDITGGINNREFQKRFAQLCKVTDPAQYAIVLMDVKDFKEINERFGISVGNKMLKYFYDVIDDHMNEENLEFAVRSESDHFFMCMRETCEEEIQRRLDEIVADINRFQNQELPVCKIQFKQGGSLAKDGTADIVALQDQARMAMKNRKQRNREGCVFYNEELAQKKKWERDLENRFETSLENQEFLPYIQPKVSLSKGCVVGGEVLVRWKHPIRGFVSPGEFIPILEGNGKIKKLDHYMFEQACIWLDRRRREGKPLYPLSVNLSRVHFFEENFLKPYLDIAEKYQIDRSLVEFEMTEGIFFDEDGIEWARHRIMQIHQYGFRCAIDDFGIGYSSLSTIREFDIDTLKLDRSFFQNLESEKARGILACLGELANSLHIQTVAEGIETREQIQQLQAIGCDVIQGYYFSKPLPIPEFEAWADSFLCREV